MTSRISITQPVFVSSALNTGTSLVTSTPHPTSFNTSRRELGIKTDNVLNSGREIKNLTSLESTREKINGALSSQTGSKSSESGNKIYGKKPIENFQYAAPRKVFVKTPLPQPVNYQIFCKNGTNNGLHLNENGTNCQYSENPGGKDKRYFRKICSGEGGSVPRKTALLLPKQSSENVQNSSMPSTGNCPLPPSFQHSRRKQERPLKSVRFADKENENPEMAHRPACRDNVSSGSNGDVAKSGLYRNVTTNQRPLLPKISVASNACSKSNRSLLIPSNSRGPKVASPRPSEKTKPTVLHPVAGTAVRNASGIMRPQVVSSVYGSACRSQFQIPKYRYSSGQLQPKYRYTGPFPYRRMGTATRSNSVSLKKCRIVFPSQVKTRCNLTSNASRAANVPATTKLLAVPVNCANGPAEVVARQRKPNPSTVPKKFGSVSSSAQSTGSLTRRQDLTSPPTGPGQSGNAPKSLILVVSEKSIESSAPSSQEENDGNANVSNATVQENCRQGGESGKRGKNKIQEAQEILSKISQLLSNINRTFATGFECPGLESSLPMWKSELEQCILSVDKINGVLLEYQDKMKK